MVTESPTSTSNIWGDRLFTILTILVGISFMAILVLGSYYDQPITQALSFDIQDGQCDPETQGVGLHCFGDFHDIRKQLELPIIWDGTLNPYPPTGLLPSLLVKPIESLFGVRVSLFFFIALLFFAVATPAMYIVTTSTRTRRLYIRFACFVLFSQPVFFPLDRGNGSGFIVPLMMLYAVKLNRKPNWYATLAIAGAAAIRPQFALLAVGLLAFGQIKHFLASIFATLSMIFIPFIFWPGNHRTNLAMWFHNITSYSSGAKTDVAGKYPVNLSMRSVADHLDAFLKNSISSGFQNYYVLISLIVLAAITCALFACRKTNAKSLVLIVSLSLPCLMPETSFGYYSMFTLVLASLIFSDASFFSSTANRNAIRISEPNAIHQWFIISAVAIAVAPIPFVFEVGRNSISLEFFGVIWSFVLLSTVARLIADNRRFYHSEPNLVRE